MKKILAVFMLSILGGCSTNEVIKDESLYNDPNSVLQVDPSMDQFIKDFDTYIKDKDYRLAAAVLDGWDCSSETCNYSVAHWEREYYNLSSGVKRLITPFDNMARLPNNKCKQEHTFGITVGQDDKVKGLFLKRNPYKDSNTVDECLPVLKRRMNNYVNNLLNENSYAKISEETLLLDGVKKKKKISAEQYFQMCDTKNISSCPIDPNTGNKDETCNTLRIACLNSLLHNDLYKDAKTYFEHAIRAESKYGVGLGNGGALLSRGDTSYAPKNLREDLYEYRRVHLNEVISLYKNNCSLDSHKNKYACDVVEKLKTEKTKHSSQKTNNTSHHTDITEQINRNPSEKEIETKGLCKNLVLRKVYSGYTIGGRPDFYLQLTNRNPFSVEILKINVNRTGWKLPFEYGRLNFGERLRLSLDDAVELDLMTDQGNCTFTEN